MVVTDTLKDVGIKALTQAYNLGFSDYKVPLTMSEERLKNILARNGYRPDCSVGLFDGTTLVGFVLNGVRANYCYDSGTAIIPSYRGKGYARLLLKKALSVLETQAVRAWVLEVLTDNTKAINLYTSIGFTRQRMLNCYHSKAEAIREKETTTRVSLIRQKTIDIPHGECIPSWQNEAKSIIAGGVPTWDITMDKKKMGTLCYDPETGSIAQIYIQEEERRKGYAKEAIIEAFKLCKAERLRFINIEDCYLPLNSLMKAMGFECFATQVEMIKAIGDRA